MISPLFQNPLFIDQNTEKLFKLNKLSNFEQLWALDCEWFEPPNYRRNGMSGVIKYPLKNAAGEITQVFIKRQENHNHKTLLHPIKGVPTFRQEYINIRRLTNKKIPTLTALFYGERIVNGKTQSILITRSLEGYQSFEDYFHIDNKPEDNSVRKIMQTCGKNIRLLHEANYCHGSLYPKHFFVKANSERVDVRLIDLEKLKWYPVKYFIRYNDLSRFIRRGMPMAGHKINLLIESYLKQGKDLSQTRLAERLYSLLK